MFALVRLRSMRNIQQVIPFFRLLLKEQLGKGRELKLDHNYQEITKYFSFRRAENTYTCIA